MRFGRNHRGEAVEEAGGEAADPEIESQRLREAGVPVVPQRGSREPPHDLVEQVAEGAGMVAVALPGRPPGRLPLYRRDHFGVGEDVRTVVRGEGGQAGLVGEELEECQAPVPRGEQLGPDCGDGIVRRVSRAFEGEEEGDGGGALCRRPDRDERFGGPGRPALGIDPAAMEGDDLLSALPDRDRSAQLAELVEIPVKAFFEGLHRHEISSRIAARSGSARARSRKRRSISMERRSQVSAACVLPRASS